MANVQVAGFIPIAAIGGGFIEYKRVRVLTNNTTAICLNDAVVQAIAGGGDYIVAATATIAIATTSGGASYVDANGQRVQAKHLPAATLYTSSGVDPYNASYINVVSDGVGVKYRASVDEAIALTDLNLNYAMVLGAGTNGISGHELDATGRAATATIPWRVKDFFFCAESDPDAADAHVVCYINASTMEPALEIGGSLGT